MAHDNNLWCASVVQAIINCYGKARAFRQLGSFFDSLAMTMMDEMSDYPKSLKYLKNAHKFLKKEKVCMIRRARNPCDMRLTRFMLVIVVG